MFYNRRQMFIKKAGPDVAGVGGAVTPAGGGTGGGKGSSSSSGIKDWTAYVNNISPPDKNSTPQTRFNLAKKWVALTRDGKFEDDLGNKYTTDYLSFGKWWSLAKSTSELITGTVEETTQKIGQLLESKSPTAGAKGTDSGDSTLSSYLTKLLPLNLTGRGALFQKINTAFLSAGQPSPILSGTSGKQYVDPEKVSFVLGIPGYIQVIKTSYDTDGADPSFATTLYLAQDGAPGSSISSATTSGASTPQSQTPQSQTGGVANLSVINGQQYYQIPAGKLNLFVRKGKPYGDDGIMMQDTRAGKISKPQNISNSPRFREYLGSREIARILQMVEAAEGRQNVPAYKAVLEGQRLDNSGWRRLITFKKREDKIGEEAQKYKDNFPTTASTRQSRLDSLRKKGVI